MENDNSYIVNNNEKITATMTLKSDQDINKLLRTSEISGVPLIFRGDRIVDFKMEGLSEFNNFSPDKISIGPIAYHFDLKFGDEVYSNIPFDKKRITENIIIFEPSIHAKIDLNIKIKIIKSENLNFNINISPKSNKIKDILNYELFKKKVYNRDFEFKISDEQHILFKGKLPIIDINDEEIEFFKKVNFINNELNLNILIDDEYIITNDDVLTANRVCEFIKTKKINIGHITLSILIKPIFLNKFIDEKKQILIEEKNYTVKLLNNDVNLGSFKVFIEKHEVINLEEITKIYNEKKYDDEMISIDVTLKDYNSDELYLDFNS